MESMIWLILWLTSGVVSIFERFGELYIDRMSIVDLSRVFSLNYTFT